ncbi:M23 family metallopeptidase [Cellulomonas massiliensis]|uniref:M23 family metallopeptidase n=1 Tax=Cellulomonas massiliensis TaxID=1465811 RepID=UPI00030D1A15|nr:M23 family metallopeptidase [Cellulomonas massiliensis]
MRKPLRAAAVAVVTALVATTTFVASVPAAADSIDDRRAAAERARKENAQRRADAEEAMEGVRADLAKASDRLLEIREKIPVAQERLDRANDAYDKAMREADMLAARLRDAGDEKSALGESIEQDAAKAEQVRDAIGQMAREAYRGGGDVSGVSVMLEAESTEDFVERYGLVSTALRTQAQMLDELRTSEASGRNSAARLDAVEERIAELKKQADAKVAEADEARREAQAARAALDKLLADEQKQKQRLEAKKDEIRSELAKADTEAKKIRNQLKAAIAAQRRRDAKNNQGGSKPTGSVSGAIFANPTAISPIYVTSEYGMRFHPVLHYWRLHAGIDLRDHCGMPVYAGRSGTVLWAQSRYGYGNQVMVDHGLYRGNGLQSSYNHLTRWVVQAGQHVKVGQLLGYAGNTGTSGGCHLHFEVYVNGSTVNPRSLLGL